MQILRQLFTVTDADGYVPKSFLQAGDTPVEDDPNSKAWRYGADALESRDFSIEHPLEDGLKLFFMTDPTHVLKSRWTSDPLSPR